MKELISEIIMEAEVNTSFIADAKDIVATYFEMRDMGFEFFEENTVEDVLEQLEENDILAITKMIDDGYVEYFVEEVFGKNGETLLDDVTEEVYVVDELADCIDFNKYENADVILVGEDEKDYNEDVDYAVEETIENITNELIEDLNEFVDESDFCPHCAIKDSIEQAFYEGYAMAIEDLESDEEY